MTVAVEIHGHVGLIEMRDPPHNFLNAVQVGEVAEALEGFDRDPAVRCAVLAAEGRSFCAGANFGGGGPGGLQASGASRPPGGSASAGQLGTTEQLYAAAARLVDVETPWVAAVHGPAIGGGLGLALTATLRVTCPEARFSANFVKLGIHQGFGLSVTLPELLGPSKAAMVLLTGRRYKGDEATALGLADVCVPQEQVRETAMSLAGEIASGAPLAIAAINRTLRRGLGDRLREATKHEAAEQGRLSQTEDAREGILSVNERREGRFAAR